MQKDPEFPKQKICSDFYKSKEQGERNKIISRFLEKEFIWTVSDRSEDQREVDSERVSEATFCKILLLSKHIKTDGKQKLQTTCCRKCSEHNNFQQALEIFGQEDFKACLEEDDLAYFEEQNEDRLLHTCPICGRKNSN